MKTEPALDRDALRRQLLSAYGLSATAFTFVPTGWMSSCYNVICAGGVRVFVKLQPTNCAQPVAASCPEFYLPLTRGLHDTGLLTTIAYPLPTSRGDLWVQWGDWRIIVNNFIDGHVVGLNGVTDGVLGQLAAMVGRLHRSLPALDLPVAFRDRLEIPFEAALRTALATLGEFAEGATPGQLGLRDLLVPCKDELMGYLHLLETVRADVEASGLPQPVICHTDLHGENLMVDGVGRLYILDWEGAILAPREQDLFAFVGGSQFQDVFLPAYEAEGGPLVLHEDLLAFYGLRRHLEDLTDWILLILAGRSGAEKDAADLLATEDCLMGLRDRPWQAHPGT